MSPGENCPRQSAHRRNRCAMDGCLPFVISIASLIGLSAGLSAAENTFRLEETTIAEIRKAVAAGALSSEKLVELYLARIAAYDRAGPRLNSIIYINPNAKAEAAALDRERRDKGRRGPLHGIPVLLKDNIDVANMPTTNGSAVMKDAIPPEDSSITKALRAAGAVILGKAAMGEFAGGSGSQKIKNLASGDLAQWADQF